MYYDAEIVDQCVTVTHVLLSMPVTTEEELKKFYFTAFGARLPIQQTIKKKVSGVLPLSRNFIVYK